MKRKMGPLPVWAWLVIAAGGVWLYWRHINAQTAQTPPPLDPTQDPGLLPTTGPTSDGSQGPTSGQELQGAMSDIALVDALMKMMEGLFKDFRQFQNNVAGTGHKHHDKDKHHKKGNKPPAHQHGNKGQHLGDSPGGRGGHGVSGNPLGKDGSTHRAPAHQHENAHHQAHTHFHHRQPNPPVHSGGRSGRQRIRGR